MNRYFISSPELYESIRATMDAANGYPSTQADTWFAPIENAPKDSGGNPLIAAIDPIAEQFIAAGCEELSAEQYATLLPTK